VAISKSLFPVGNDNKGIPILGTPVDKEIGVFT